jgi:hypothetical protein
MIEITRADWDNISWDYKGHGAKGVREVFGGCIKKQGGTDILTEGVDFIIVKEKP